MEWKYRKEFQIMPGLKLHYGNNGLTTEIQPSKDISQEEIKHQAEKLKHQLYKPYEDIHEIKSASIEKLTSESLYDFRNLLLTSGQSYDETKKILSEKISNQNAKSKKINKLQKNIFKFLFKKKLETLQQDLNLLEDEIEELKEQLNLSVVRLEINSEDAYTDLYKLIQKSFYLLTQSEKKWDFTSSKLTNRVAERTSASSTITRSEIEISTKGLPILQTKELPICFHNINGGDIYFYPGFMIIYETKTEFALVNYIDLTVNFGEQRFIETEPVPKDSKVIDYTWDKVNKDGSPDRRFTSNYKIPIALYGKMEFTSLSGLKESYCFSNVEYSALFYKALLEYIDTLKKSALRLKAFTEKI